jgi:hypothetical protein
MTPLGRLSADGGLEIAAEFVQLLLHLIQVVLDRVKPLH